MKTATPFREAVAQAVAAEPGSATEIADRLGFNRHLVAHLLADMERAGLVRRAGMTSSGGKAELIWQATAR